MFEITVEDFKKLDFQAFESNPILRPFDGSPLVADPSLLIPEESPDNKWHMFFHTNLGVYHFASDDGISFTKIKKLFPNAMRPNINFVDGKYFLFFEKTRSLPMNALNLFNIVKWKSEIMVSESVDLVNWTKPVSVISEAGGYEKSSRGSSISNPFLLRKDGKNFMYFSCGLTFIKDCGFCEPTYIMRMESEYVSSEYKDECMVVKPDPDNEYLNLCSGCIKVYELSDGYIGIQNGIFEKDGISYSAILLLSSNDGTNFKFEKVLVEPGAEEWMKQYVYASHLVKVDDSFRLYFNARDNSSIIRGRECIGFFEAKITVD